MSWINKFKRYIKEQMHIVWNTEQYIVTNEHIYDRLRLILACFPPVSLKKLKNISGNLVKILVKISQKSFSVHYKLFFWMFFILPPL